MTDQPFAVPRPQAFVRLDTADVVAQSPLERAAELPATSAMRRITEKLAADLTAQGVLPGTPITVGIDPPSAEDFERNTITIRAEAPSPLTPEQRAEQDRKAAEAWEQYDAVVAAMERQDGALGTVLALHAPAMERECDSEFTMRYTQPTCNGCEVDGYDAEQPAWPCRTVQTYAEWAGLPCPSPHALRMKYDPEAKEWKRP